MKISIKLRNRSIAAVLVAIAASASAVESTQDVKDEVLSTASRANVQAGLANARATEQIDQRREVYGSYGHRGVDSTLSRAEVIADLLLWRESGMAELSIDMTGLQIFSDRYPQAQARYAELRASPRYAQLVKQIAEQGGEVAAASSASASAR